MRHLKTCVFQGACCVAFIVLIWLCSVFPEEMKYGRLFQAFLDSVQIGSPFFWRHVFKSLFNPLLCFAPACNLIFSYWHWLIVIRCVFLTLSLILAVLISEIFQEWCDFFFRQDGFFFPPSMMSECTLDVFGISIALVQNNPCIWSLCYFYFSLFEVI